MPRICIKASLNPYLYTAYCVSHGWLLLMHNTVDTWHKEVTAQIAKYKKREKIVRVEGGQEIQARWNNRKCPKFSALLIRLKYHFFVGEMHDRTDLKSPSTSESSQMYSWGTFLLFRRCSSLLFCGEGYRNITSWIYQQKFMIRKSFFQYIILMIKCRQKGQNLI